MPRKGENIHKRKDGRWEGRYIDFHKPSGKPHYKSIYGISYAEVKNLLRLDKQGGNKSQNTSDKTVEDVSNEWLGSVKIRIKASSYSRYYTIVINHIVPYFKDTPISTFTNDVIEAFVKTKISKGLSAKTIRSITAVLIQIVKYAGKRKYIEPISCDVTLPKIHSNKLAVITPEQQEKLVEYIKKNLNRETLGILIALYTGVRLGELCALTWGDVDFKTQEIVVASSIQRIKDFAPKAITKTKLIIDEPKSEKSARNIPLPAFLLEILMKFNRNHNRNEYILSGTIKPTEPRTYQNRFKAHMTAAGLQNVNFHIMRHTFATRAIEVEFDIKSLSEILGHSSVRFTLDRYVHSSQEQKKICMARMGKCY